MGEGCISSCQFSAGLSILAEDPFTSLSHFTLQTCLHALLLEAGQQDAGIVPSACQLNTTRTAPPPHQFVSMNRFFCFDNSSSKVVHKDYTKANKNI